MSAFRVLSPWVAGAFALFLALPATADTPPVPDPSPSTTLPTVRVAAEPVAAIPGPDQILAIPPALRAMLQTRVIGAANSRDQRLEKLVHLIFDEDGMHLEYDPYATHTLAETWQTGRANCLSFTLLFTTLARAAGIDARVQEVAQVVSWYQDEGVIYSVGHVNVGVQLTGRTATVDLDRNVLYDRYGPRPITEQRALAHFYNNRGAQAMAAGDLALAQRYLEAAVAQSAEFTPGWNNLGVLHTREGNLARARSDYETALRVQPRNAAALSNASLLYQRMGETKLAAQLKTRLERIQKDDPFAQFRLGNQAEQRHDYAQAVHYYKRAVRLYSTAHQFHFGLARAYFLSGDNRRASQEMARARDLAGENADVLRASYQAKLDSIQRWRSRGM